MASVKRKCTVKYDAENAETANNSDAILPFAPATNKPQTHKSYSVSCIGLLLAWLFLFYGFCIIACL